VRAPPTRINKKQAHLIAVGIKAELLYQIFIIGDWTEKVVGGEGLEPPTSCL
jgi:hypothetical protein